MFRNDRMLLYICRTMNYNLSCSFCIEAGNKNKSIRNIIKESISPERLSSYFFKTNHLENSECIDCPVLPVCGGGCPLDRETDQGVNKVACSFY